MNEEEINSGERAQIVIGEDISMLSIDELEKRIRLLEREIGRVKSDIAAKNISKDAAESIFRS